MKTLTALSMALLCAGLSVALAVAEGTVETQEAKEITVEGKVLCAKCSLKEEGRDKCQNVIVVESDGKQQYYYMAKNATYEEFGEVCQGSPRVRVTGTVTTRDGKDWLSASKVERLDAPKEG